MIGKRLEHERPDDALRADDFAELSVKTELLTIGRTVHHPPCAPDAEVALAEDHGERARPHPALQVLRLREGVEHERSGRIDDAAGYDGGLTGFSDDFELVFGHEASPWFAVL